jgi:hypothetical protein
MTKMAARGRLSDHDRDSAALDGSPGAGDVGGSLEAQALI